MINKKILGLDIGQRRVGVASGDAAVKIASPLPPIANDAQVFQKIVGLVDDNSIKTIVVGLPRDQEGRETKQSRFSRDFADELAKFTSVKIVFQDESLTSAAAEENLRARRNFDDRMLRDGTLDSEAAAIILQDFLEGC
ncbi:Holliday junction resolvase RuvX [Candidatus Saccharibacteria bacterium]|nr:Holliday junction resolvase RuvX [Candidatus Saccharibacteria bacterium]MCL1963409.1 Holliday junction resolvase RuvX [Candidatus Saccharibacteria bacterium]